MSRARALKLLVAAGVVLGVMVFLWRRGTFAVLDRIAWHDMLAFLLITVLSCYLLGLQTSYLMWASAKARLSTLDRFLLPLGMALWGYILPVNGGGVYSMFVLKQKYGIRLVQSVAIAVYTIYLSLVLTGLTGVVLCIRNGRVLSLFMLASLGFVLSPAILPLGVELAGRLPFLRKGFVGRALAYLREFTIDLSSLLRDWKLALVNTAAYAGNIFLSVICYWWAIQLMGWQLTLGQLTMCVLVARVSSIVRILPGNAGVEELVSGGLFALFGQGAEKGALIALLFRVVGLLAIVPGGILHTAHSMRALNLESLGSLRARLGRSQAT